MPYSCHRSRFCWFSRCLCTAHHPNHGSLEKILRETIHSIKFNTNFHCNYSKERNVEEPAPQTNEGMQQSRSNNSAEDVYILDNFPHLKTLIRAKALRFEVFLITVLIAMRFFPCSECSAERLSYTSQYSARRQTSRPNMEDCWLKLVKYERNHESQRHLTNFNDLRPSKMRNMSNLRPQEVLAAFHC